MSIQQNFPAISPSLTLNFARSKTLDPRITFTRTSSATRINGQGLVEVVPANSARFDHSYDPVSGTVRSLGLLIEEARTNLVTYSQGTGMNTTNWSGASGVIINENVVISPAGDLTANKLIATSENILHLFSSNTFAVTSGTTYTFSCFFKAAEFSWIYFRTGGSPFGSNGLIYNLDTETTGTLVNTLDSPPIIQKYPNGWYKIIITKTAALTGNGTIQIIVPNGNSTSTFSGDDVSGFYVWGAQVEQGAFPTSYIPTSGSTVTRTADNASMVGENFSSWYNQSEGTVYVNANSILASFPGRFPNAYMISDGTINNKIEGLGNNGNGWSGFTIRKSNVPQTPIFSPVAGNNLISAGAYKENDAAVSTKGATPITDNLVEIPEVNTLYIGGSFSASGANILNGHISQLTYYPKRLPNAFLQNLTK